MRILLPVLASEVIVLVFLCVATGNLAYLAGALMVLLLFAAVLINRRTEHADLREREAKCKEIEQRIRAAQKVEAMGRLAGGLAHDFINLLTAVSGWCQLVASHLPADDEAQGPAQELFLAIDSAASVSRQMMSLGRQYRQQPRTVHLGTLVGGLEKMLRSYMGKQIVLEMAADRALWPVVAEVGQLEQIVLNLVVNARDAMPQGGRLDIEARNVDRGRDGRFVQLTVRDSGCGMTGEVQARIFEPFFTTKDEGRGTGLGLTIVREIVEESGGWIEVHSESGQGSTFRIYLPSSEPRPVSPRAPSSTTPMPESDLGWREVRARGPTPEVLSCF
jgi:signal transduction histidine kinase